MLIGLISDTHDHSPHIKQAVQIFKQHKVDLVLHAGDYCSPFTIAFFEDFSLKGVVGKNDGDHPQLKEKFEAIGGTLGMHFLDLEANDRKIALYSGIEPPITAALEHCGHYDIVVSGHTHEKKKETIDETLAINPGTAHGFGNEATFALLNTDSMRVEFMSLYQ
ncbi:MAG TPA: YfcE family phosphodiesterase [Balneolaceae bacterium]